MYSQSGAMILRNSRIYSNHSPLDAGGGLWLEGNASPEIYHSIQNVLIHHNSALAMGGGVKLFDNYAELVNCQKIIPHLVEEVFILGVHILLLKTPS